MKEVKVLQITQPIGTFYMGVMLADDLADIVRIRLRSQNEDAVQRDESRSRIAEISEYCSDQDATFPTPIIVSIFPHANAYIKDNTLYYDENELIGEVIDGQHRLKGILRSANSSLFELPVIFMMNLTNEENAYVFSVINSKQTKVSSSLIYDLFGMSNGRSPQKTVHELARSMNSNEKSPFFNRLKMLGTRAEGQENATLSQGTFASYIIKLLSKNPIEDSRLLKRGVTPLDDESLPLRAYFIRNKDEVILKILLNCFNALRSVYPDEWNNPQNNILWKTTGFGSVVLSLTTLLKIGIANKHLTETFFRNCFLAFKEELERLDKKLVSEDFGSGQQAQKRLADIIIEAVKNKDSAYLLREA